MMEYNVDFLLSPDLASILDKNRSSTAVRVLIDGAPLCELNAEQPRVSLRMPDGSHQMTVLCTVEEVCVKFEYHSEFSLVVDDDFDIEIYKVQRDYQILARKICDFSKEDLPCALATAERTITNEKPYGEFPPRSDIVIDSKYKRNIMLHTALIFLTFGIYYGFWVYKTTTFTNYVLSKPERDPKIKGLLCALVPFYEIGWNLETAQRLDQMAIEVGVKSDLESVWQIGSISLLFTFPIIFQRKINQIVRRVERKRKLAQGGAKPKRAKKSKQAKQAK